MHIASESLRAHSKAPRVADESALPPRRWAERERTTQAPNAFKSWNSNGRLHLFARCNMPWIITNTSGWKLESTMRYAWDLSRERTHANGKSYLSGIHVQGRCGNWTHVHERLPVLTNRNGDATCWTHMHGRLPIRITMAMLSGWPLVTHIQYYNHIHTIIWQVMQY